MIVPVFIDPSD
jgi:hypothetical protein